jgi:SHS2 domain-containing protein
MENQGFREVAHTADWEIEAWGGELPDLFTQSARGMYVLSGVRQADKGRRTRRSLQLEAVEPERLLVRFLSELLHFAESERLAFDEIDVQLHAGEQTDSLKLTARLGGRKITAQDKEIKAVTFHNLLIRRKQGGFIVNVVFDV